MFVPRGGRSYAVLVLSTIFLALMVAIFPMISPYNALRPEILCLVVIYWVTTTPQLFGVFFSWSVGFAQDMVEGVVWGAHATSLAIVAYICLVAHQRIKNYSVWHQTLWVFVLVGTHQVIVNWFQGLNGYKEAPIGLVLSAIVSALFWPLIYLCLARIRHRLRLH